MSFPRNAVIELEAGSYLCIESEQRDSVSNANLYEVLASGSDIPKYKKGDTIIVSGLAPRISIDGRSDVFLVRLDQIQARVAFNESQKAKLVA